MGQCVRSNLAAATSVWAATSPLLDDMGGVYCEDRNSAPLTDPESELARVVGVNHCAVDGESGERLWTMTADTTGINAFA